MAAGGGPHKGGNNCNVSVIGLLRGKTLDDGIGGAMSSGTHVWTLLKQG